MVQLALVQYLLFLLYETAVLKSSFGYSFAICPSSGPVLEKIKNVLLMQAVHIKMHLQLFIKILCSKFMAYFVLNLLLNVFQLFEFIGISASYYRI
jgi:hypothetical protein